MSNEDFELLLAMAEEAENAESTIDTPCENIHTEDPPAETAKAPEAPTSLMAEEEDEDFKLLSEMAAQAEAAGNSDQDMLPATIAAAASEPEAFVAFDLPPKSPGTKRKAAASPPAVKKARSSSDTEHRTSLVPAMAADGSKPEHNRPSSAAFQPVSGRYGRGTTGHTLTSIPQSAKTPSTEKLVEKHSGLRMKNPVFPSIVFGERLSHLQFLRLHRAGERVKAADSGGPWATVGVLVEKSKPRTSATGSMYSLWKLSDLDGATVTMLLFGDAHQDHFRESEGSVVAIFNAEADGKGGLTLKVNESSSILKLATSSDFALCGSRKKDGTSCRNPVNISKCRFCDYHVQTESRRINSSRGVLQDSSHAAKLNTQAEQAAQRHKKHQFAPYVPKQMTQEELAIQTVRFGSQGARHIAALQDSLQMKTAAQENFPHVVAAQRSGNAHQTGRRGQESGRELPHYTGAQQASARPRQQLSQAAIALPRTAGVDPARPPRAPLPQQQTPRAARPAGTAIIRPLTGTDGGSARPAGAARDSIVRRATPAGGGGTAATTARLEAQQAPSGRPNGLGRSGVQSSSSDAARARPLDRLVVKGPAGASSGRPSGSTVGRAPAGTAGRGGAQAERANTGFVMLEEAEIDWDVADVAALKRHTRTDSSAQRVDTACSPESDDEGGGGFSGHVRRSGVRCPEPASFASGSSRGSCVASCRPAAVPHPADAAAERARQEAIHKAVELVKRCGGMEAAMEAAKKDQKVAAVTRIIQQPADASETVQEEAAPNTGPTTAPSISGAGAGAKPAGRPATNFYATASAAPSAAHRGSAAAASGNHPKAAAAKSGTRSKIEVKLGMRPKSSIKASGSSAARANKPMVVPPGTSAFAAAFGSAVTEEDMRNVGTRYKETVEDEEAEKMDRLLGSMQKKDELQQRAEAITQLSVSAWHCSTCDIITERRKPHCQEHVGKRVSATKRWWTCSGCNNRFTTVGVKYPTKRCPNPRCTAPNSEFKKSSMGRAPKIAAGAEAPVAAREHFQPRGREHGFALNS